jgi:hypothetical protein
MIRSSPRGWVTRSRRRDVVEQRMVGSVGFVVAGVLASTSAGAPIT